MIAIVSVRQTADKPNFPLRPLPVFRGSSMTLGIVDVPPTRESIAVTGVSLAVENAVGAVVSASAVESGGVWTATIPASHFAAVGVVAMGVTISASGTDENGAARSWIVGKGDLSILPADGVPVPGETLQNVHLRDAVPATPLKGDLCEGANGWQIYTGEEWAVISPDLSNYATKADATLTERGFTEWETNQTGEFNGETWYYPSPTYGGDGKWYMAQPMSADAECSGGADATSLTFHDDDCSGGNITFIRTALSGYRLGPDSESNPNRNKPLASEAEAEALRTGKADKVASATSGNFAGLDASGNLTDSGKKPADFATAAQGAKADAPIQPATRDSSNNITSFYAAYRDGALLGVGQFPSWYAHNLKADASSLPASETWTFEVDDGQGGTTTITKNVAVYAAGGNA